MLSDTDRSRLILFPEPSGYVQRHVVLALLARLLVVDHHILESGLYGVANVDIVSLSGPHVNEL
jgi:hypothetical protein